ncbi:hypothetical protein EDEG_03835 [Edhazardia aedis USNM 41457]|uniref:Uncharacterized protein n=1 Tax=Edhazardia aedis (strain USNM 41457) TaxID=1003232 RepID=J9D215_EDHAE|nr:hypothetical protein EDEG_03835 [Edhazardia aedis USNM 41457]|eukprot:EJW01619.1 hypothetical protein EDEG_03835 [Edhazardia aedis USNM 41457]
MCINFSCLTMSLNVTIFRQGKTSLFAVTVFLLQRTIFFDLFIVIESNKTRIDGYHFSENCIFFVKPCQSLAGQSQRNTLYKTAYLMLKYQKNATKLIFYSWFICCTLDTKK